MQFTAYHDSHLLAGTHIVAMAAGYIDPPPAELVIALRKQVLVAVTSNWQVMCFDHNLRLLWETTILVCPCASTKPILWLLHAQSCQDTLLSCTCMQLF